MSNNSLNQEVITKTQNEIINSGHPEGSFQLGEASSDATSYLERLKKRVEIYEDDLWDLVLARVDEEQHVGDTQEGKQDQRGLHGFSADQTSVTGSRPTKDTTHRAQSVTYLRCIYTCDMCIVPVLDCLWGGGGSQFGHQDSHNVEEEDEVDLSHITLLLQRIGFSLSWSSAQIIQLWNCFENPSPLHLCHIHFCHQYVTQALRGSPIMSAAVIHLSKTSNTFFTCGFNLLP